MYTYSHPHPAVTTDIVVIAGTGDERRVLLIRRLRPPFADCWALPGGFVDIDEGLEAAAARELNEETGLEGLELKQLHAFGEPGRDPRERVISIAYVALVDGAPPGAQAASDAAVAAWFPVGALPDLAFDHDVMIAMALRSLERDSP